jgi:glyoxylase-like metal-dependent hydrolase (beta-lactamase superfamily II)
VSIIKNRSNETKRRAHASAFCFRVKGLKRHNDACEIGKIKESKEEEHKMNSKKHPPILVTEDFYQLGTPSFPAYLSMGEIGMIIEGGTGPTFQIIVDQIRGMGMDPEKIKYIVLTHTHADHIGGVPHFKRAWPHIKVLASPMAAKILQKKELINEFILVDTGIAQLMKAKDEISQLPPALEEYAFDVDRIVKEGDRIELGSGLVWDIYETPGHSPCHISLFEEGEGTLVIGDATGFYVPQRDAFWPNYFVSLENYCDSIRKLATLPAKRAALSHNCVIEGDVGLHLKKAMKATEAYHHELMERLGKGETPESIAMDKARFVDSLTDIQPFKVMYDLSRVMVKRSRENQRDDCFEF